MTAPSDGPVAAPRTAAASALWRDMLRAAGADPGFAWALGLGIVLIALGLLGFVPNPLVGAPSAAWGMPLLLTGDAHDVTHLVGGAVALHAALGMSRARRDTVLIVVGGAALVLLALGLLDGRWFGIAPWPVGLADQLLHLIVGVGSLVMGLAGTGAIVVPVVTGAYRRSAAAVAAEPAIVPAPVAGTAPVPDADPAAATSVADADLALEPAPAEAMPEPLGLDVVEEAPASGTDEAVAEPVVVAEPLGVADTQTPAGPEAIADTQIPAEPQPTLELDTTESGKDPVTPEDTRPAAS